MKYLVVKLLGCMMSVGFLGSSVVKNPPTNTGDSDSNPGWRRSREKEMAIHSSFFAWEIPWAEEPGGLQSRGQKTVGYNLVTKQKQQ